MENGMEQYYSDQTGYAEDQAVYAADQPAYAEDQAVYAADQPMYVDEPAMYAHEQPMYMDEPALYGHEQAMYGHEQPLRSPEGEQAELPPEPEDSPYEDPVVRHILSLKDDKYRTRMLRYLNEKAKPNTDLHPAVVLLALLVFFPAGLCMMYFGTRWGGFAKTVITIFVLLMAFALYEILVLGDILPTPSLIETVGYIIGQFTA